MDNQFHSDAYSEAVPIEELVALAKDDMNQCPTGAAKTVHQCVEKVVREKLCPCAASVSGIVDAVVSEYERQKKLTK